MVLEDDPYGLLRFEGEPVPTIFELAGGDGVIFLSSFSKTVAPGIRVGYVILPEELVGAVERQVLENYVSPSIFVQAALAEFVADGNFDRNVERTTRRSADPARRDARRARPRGARGRRGGTSPRAATSSGSTCRRASTPPTSCAAATRPASRS